MLRKYASLAVLDVRMWNDTRRVAHRATFNYTPRPGFLYVRSRAISSRTNDNFDHFPASEIATAWRSFIGKPVFVNHHNSDHRRARGVIIDAALHNDTNPDGSPDVWVELLHEVDAVKFPKLAEAILKGWIERTSMGCDVQYSICSACGNQASTPSEYCRHIPSMKGQKIRRKNAATGSTEDVLVYESCFGLSFFENSLLVEEPADPTAFFVGVDDRGVGGGYEGSLVALDDPGLTPGLAKAAVKTAGEWQQAVDKVQRDGGFTLSTHGEQTPTDGYMVSLPNCEEKVPVVELDEGEIVEFVHEHERDLQPVHRFLGGWLDQSTVYLDVSQHDAERAQAIADGEQWRQLAIFDLANQQTIYLSAAKAASATPKKVRFFIQCDPANHDAKATHGHIKGLHETHFGKTAKLAWKTAARTSYTLVDTLGSTGYTYELHSTGCADLNQPKYSQMPTTVFEADSIEDAIAQSVDEELGYDLSDLKVLPCARSGQSGSAIVDPNVCPGSGQLWDNPSRRLQLPCPTCGKMLKAGDMRTGRNRNDVPRHAPAKTGARMATPIRRVATPRRKLAYGETIAPAQVETIRDDSCPVCGEVDGYNGERCQTCGYFKPPSEFMDPDLARAKQVDLRQSQEETQEINQDGDSDDVFDLDPNAPAPDQTDDPGQGGDAKVEGEVNATPGVDDQKPVQNAAPSQAPTRQDSPPPNVAPVAPDGAQAPQLKGDTFNLTKPTQDTEDDPLPAEPDPAVPVQPAKDPSQEVKTPPPSDKEDKTDKAPEKDAEEDDEDDKPSKSKNPFSKKTSRNGREAPMRPTLRALAEQQIMLDANRKAIRAIAELAGVKLDPIFAEEKRKMASLRRMSDAENPAQPVPAPAAEGASETSDSALGNTSDADVTSVGDAGQTDTSPTATVDATAVGQTMADTDADTASVTAPNSGIELSENDSTTDGDVTGHGLDPENAFPINPEFAKGSSKRVFASIRLARLRQQAGIADPRENDLALGERIASTMSEAAINSEIQTLSQVVTNAQRNASVAQQAPRPREARRVTPSLGIPSQQPGLQSTASTGSVDNDALMFLD